MTESVSITNTAPRNISRISNLPITARVPSRPPIASEPVSPMNTCAFGLLYLKNPTSAPATAADIIATSGYPENSAIIEHIAKGNIPVAAANPSSPSVRL